MLPRHLRAAIFIAAGSYFVLGPVYTQVFFGAPHSKEEPWRPMQWAMYHSVGFENCQGEFWAIRDGQRVEYTKRELEKAMPRIRGGGNSRWDAGRHVRDYDVVWNTTHDVAQLAKLVCDREPNRSTANVHVYARCAPGWPGGKWKDVADGTKNMCAP